MIKLGTLHFHPERIGWISALLIGAGLCFGMAFVVVIHGVEAPFVALEKKEKEGMQIPFSFALGLKEKGPILPVPDLQGEMTFSFDPPRPIGGAVNEERVFVRLKKSGESKKIPLPSRLDLEFQGDLLKFANPGSSLWLELALNKAGQIEATLKISSLEGVDLDMGGFVSMGQESPILGAQELEGSCFRLLAEGKWWGVDQFQEEGKGERLEIGSDLLEVSEKGWLIFRDGKWQKSLCPESDVPIARVQSISAKKGLVLEGWDSNGHIRIGLSPAEAPLLKIKGEDLFSSVRIRSEKQISCMIEKQCMVLKTGDWVAKLNGRWKILRKKEERDHFLNGKLSGELFVFDKISQKQGQKMVQGRLFNSGRTQVVAIEMGAIPSRKTGGKK